MRPLSARGPAPNPLGDSDDEKATRQGWYADLYKMDKAGRPTKDIKDRWNREEKGKKVIRDAVRALSTGECAWCGARVAGSALTVDHYLPKDLFPRLAYCWANYLPACQPCNNRKKTDKPEGLGPDTRHDPALDADDAYDPEHFLPTLSNRLIEPTVDDPAGHLRFDFGVAVYQAKTDIGTRTLKRFFNEKADAESWNQWRSHVALLVQTSRSAANLDELLRSTEAVLGRSFYIRGFAAFELEVNPPDWKRPV